MWDIMPTLMSFVTIINTLLILIIVFVQRRNTAATWAWAVACGLFPIGGFIIYMIVGQDSRKQKAFMQKKLDDDVLLAAYREMGGGTLPEEDTETYDNQLTLYHDGNTKFEALYADIAAAKRFVFVQYYILRGDETGARFIHALAEKAAEGVEVRLLIDGMGCHFTPNTLYQPFIDAGGHLGKFMPPVPVRINFRNHRKLAIIDGEVAYIGGLNIGNEYLGLSTRFGAWRDTHMRLIGSAMLPMTLRFMMDWNFASNDKLLPQVSYFPTHEPLPSAPGGAPGATDAARVRIISSGPDTRYPYVLHQFCRMIMDAKKSVYIQSPYFVPDEALFTALRIAALSGVDVRIMYPANPDHPFVYWCGLSYIGELICAGVKGYEYTNGFIHTKTLMIDSERCAVGSTNMDVRSFKINFETHAFIEDYNTTLELEAKFFEDIAQSRLWTMEAYESRPRKTKIKESVSRLFSPLL